MTSCAGGFCGICIGGCAGTGCGAGQTPKEIVPGTQGFAHVPVRGSRSGFGRSGSQNAPFGHRPIGTIGNTISVHVGAPSGQMRQATTHGCGAGAAAAAASGSAAAHLVKSKMEAVDTKQGKTNRYDLISRRNLRFWWLAEPHCCGETEDEWCMIVEGCEISPERRGKHSDHHPVPQRS